MSSLLFGNGSDVVHWKPNPDSRGTFDILTTCVITLLLCVWTAVHLNVPPPEHYWKSIFRRVFWLMRALLAPEMVAYTAWYPIKGWWIRVNGLTKARSQRREALCVMASVNEACSLIDPLPWYTKTLRWSKDTITRLTEALNMHARTPVRQPTLESRQPNLESQKPSSTGGRSPWTLAHGFYVLMGGLAISIPEDLPESKQFVPSWSCGTWFVTQGGLRLLFNDDRETVKEEILSLSKEDIESKSKANGLAKSVVCIQAVWFIATCETRFAQRIPITLLELNTFGHAICALLIYILWWEKPFEVDHPTILRNQAVWEYFALAWTREFRSSSTEIWEDSFRDLLEEDVGFRDIDRTTKDSNTRFYVHKDADLFQDFTDYHFSLLDLNPADRSEYTTNPKFYWHRYDDQDLVKVGPGQVVPGTKLKLKTAPQLKALVDDQSACTPPIPSLNLTEQDLTRLKMAEAAYEAYTGHEKYTMEELEYYWTFRRHCGDWPKRPSGEIAKPYGFSWAALIYGGLHVLAWFAHFNSTTEQLLWRISSCVVMGGLPILSIIRFLMEQHLKYHIYFSWTRVINFGFSYYTFEFRRLDTNARRATFVVCLTIESVLFPIYAFARLYLVVECFIQLSHLPAGVYNVPEWSAYFPHIA